MRAQRRNDTMQTACCLAALVVALAAVAAAGSTASSQQPENGGYPFGNNLTRGEAVRIAVTMPVTSRGENLSLGVEAMRIFHSFLPSFLDTALPTTFPCVFEFWLAYDAGDALLDSPAGQADFKRFFQKQTGGVTTEACGNHSGACITLRLRRFEHSHTLTALWNGINADAFAEGAHYFFMPNDDLKMLSPGWPVELLSILAASPGFPNLGVTGPIDPVSGRRDMPSMPMVCLCASLSLCLSLCLSLSLSLSRARALCFSRCLAVSVFLSPPRSHRSSYRCPSPYRHTQPCVIQTHTCRCTGHTWRSLRGGHCPAHFVIGSTTSGLATFTDPLEPVSVCLDVCSRARTHTDTESC